MELLATLPLLALLLLLTALLVLDTQRVARRLDGVTGRTREMRHAQEAAATTLRGLSASDLHAWNDTLLEFSATVGVGFPCGQPSPDRIDLLPARIDGVLRTSWNASADVGDRLEFATNASIMPATLAQPARPTAGDVATSASISAVGSSITGCANSSLRSQIAGSLVRLTIAPAPTTPVAIGAPVRILRRTRLSFYRSGAEWFLGLRTLSNAGWETIQPIAGPFESPATQATRFIVRNNARTALPAHTTAQPIDTAVTARPASIDVLMRATSAWKRRDGSRESDTLRTVVALRNGREP